MSKPIYIDADDFYFEVKEIKPADDSEMSIRHLIRDREISFSMKGALDAGSVWFRMHMKPLIVDIDIPDSLWMRYPKCPSCGQYVIREPKPIRIPRGCSRIHEYICWNNALQIIGWDGKGVPCKKCVKDFAKYLYSR